MLVGFCKIMENLVNFFCYPVSCLRDVSFISISGGILYNSKPDPCHQRWAVEFCLNSSFLTLIIKQIVLGYLCRPAEKINCPHSWEAISANTVLEAKTCYLFHYYCKVGCFLINEETMEIEIVHLDIHYDSNKNNSSEVIYLSVHH